MKQTECSTLVRLEGSPELQSRSLLRTDSSTGFLPDVLHILQALPAKRQSGWQGMCFSATVPPKVKEVLSHVLEKNYTSISTIDASEPPTLEKVPQFSIFIPQAQDIFNALLTLIQWEIKSYKEEPKIIVFGVTANLVALYAELFRELIPLRVFELRKFCATLPSSLAFYEGPK